MMNVGGKRVIRHKNDCSSKNDRNVIVMAKPVIVPFTPRRQRDNDTDCSQSSDGSPMMSQSSDDSPLSQSSDSSYTSAGKRCISPINLISALSTDAVVSKKRK